jgi:predicted amidohydrolase
MSRVIKVAAAQFESKMGDKYYNLQKALYFTERAAQEGANFICFPELFYTGYDLSRDELRTLSERSDGTLYRELSKAARTHKIHIVASYAEKIDIPSVTFNSAMLISDTGERLGNHRKVYLWQEEKEIFREGNSFKVYQTKYGKIGMVICYEMEYPEPARLLALRGAEVLFAPSAFMRVHLMDRYLTAIALQNLIYVVGVNTIGNKKNGSSKILDQFGNVIKEALKDTEELLVCELDLEQGHRFKSPHLDDFKPVTLQWCLDAAKSYDDTDA